MDFERTPVLVDVLMEGCAFSRAELAQETEFQREQYLLDSLLKRLRVPVEFGKIYQVKDRQQQRYAVHIPQAGKKDFGGLRAMPFSLARIQA